MQIIVQGFGEDAESSANGLGDLTVAIAGTFPLQTVWRLAEMDRPVIDLPNERIFVAAFSYGMNLVEWLCREHQNREFAVASLDGVRYDGWANPFRSDFTLPDNVVIAKAWRRFAWMPPYSSKIEGFDSVTVPWAMHTNVVSKIIPAVVSFAQGFLK